MIKKISLVVIGILLTMSLIGCSIDAHNHDYKDQDGVCELIEQRIKKDYIETRSTFFYGIPDAMNKIEVYYLGLFGEIFVFTTNFSEISIFPIIWRRLRFARSSISFFIIFS